jgi:hypothetical protein
MPPMRFHKTIDLKENLVSLLYEIQMKQCNGAYDCMDRSDEDNCKQTVR